MRNDYENPRPRMHMIVEILESEYKKEFDETLPVDVVKEVLKELLDERRKAKIKDLLAGRNQLELMAFQKELNGKLSANGRPKNGARGKSKTRAK